MWEHMYLLFILIHSFWSDIRDLEKKGDVWTWLPADGMGVVFEFSEVKFLEKVKKSSSTTRDGRKGLGQLIG